NLDWFIEGLATYASGQLTDSKLNDVKADFQKGNTPKTLNQVWKGKLKYARAGSLISFIDKKIGRKKLSALLRFTGPKEILEFIGISEEELLNQWIKSLE
ncbi:MAG: hypothetical protein L0Y35_06380, partial [Flammeovirgaceae bacterium]|nr:hypothetical protein [Flammeovirgaceae bacterium]